MFSLAAARGDSSSSKHFQRKKVEKKGTNYLLNLRRVLSYVSMLCMLEEIIEKCMYGYVCVHVPFCSDRACPSHAYFRVSSSSSLSSCDNFTSSFTELAGSLCPLKACSQGILLLLYIEPVHQGESEEGGEGSIVCNIALLATSGYL